MRARMYTQEVRVWTLPFREASELVADAACEDRELIVLFRAPIVPFRTPIVPSALKLIVIVEDIPSACVATTRSEWTPSERAPESSGKV
jgi:hypothetical protein